ncbi:hypothetical protein GQ53DRAFT_742302 [Thozetella sp. PMI_491]|nr:hypothetical protein GQ53DRAFT_742302 [Thozetella sp. PMI_491]
MEMDDKEIGASADLERGLLRQDEEPKPSAPEPKPQTRPTAYLDGLRGLAAFIVYMAHHMSWMYGAEDPVQFEFGHDGAHMVTTLPFLRIFFTGGSAAVAIFFVLSGYVLTRAPLGMLRNADRRSLFSRLGFAAIRRPFRLFFPVVAISLGFALCLHLPFGLAPLMEWPTPEKTLFAELWKWLVELIHALNPFIKHGIREQWFPYDPPVWTIAIEFTGSMLVYAVVAVLALMPARWRGGFLISTSLVFLVLLYDWAMACFVAGIALAMSDLDGIGDLPRFTRLSGSSRTFVYNFCFVFGLWLLSQTVFPGKIELSRQTFGWGWMTDFVPPAYQKDEYWRFWHAVGAVMVVFATLRLRWLQQFFLLPPLRYLGRVSFSLYLLHIPLVWTIGDRVYRTFGSLRPSSGFDSWFDNRLYIPDVGPHGFSTRFLVVQLCSLPLNLLLAEWGTLLLDEPSVKMGKWIEARIKGKP